MNRFTLITNSAHARLLAIAFIASNDFDQVCACLRFARREGTQALDCFGYFDGRHFLEASDWREGDLSTFESVRVEAYAYMGEPVSDM